MAFGGKNGFLGGTRKPSWQRIKWTDFAWLHGIIHRLDKIHFDPVRRWCFAGTGNARDFPWLLRKASFSFRGFLGESVLNPVADAYELLALALVAIQRVTGQPPEGITDKRGLCGVK